MQTNYEFVIEIYDTTGSDIEDVRHGEISEVEEVAEMYLNALIEHNGCRIDVAVRRSRFTDPKEVTWDYVYFICPAEDRYELLELYGKIRLPKYVLTAIGQFVTEYI